MGCAGAKEESSSEAPKYAGLEIGTQITQSQVDQAEEIWNQFDADADGTVTTAEVAKFFGVDEARPTLHVAPWEIEKWCVVRLRPRKGSRTWVGRMAA